jgi:hypothetical protein
MNKDFEPSMMAQACNPTYLGSNDHSSRTANAKKKVQETLCQLIARFSGVWLSSQLWKMAVKANPSTKQETISKITNAKRAEGVA